VKINLQCHVQGDVVLECINLYEDLDHEEMVFRIMFNTAFIRSNILMLNRDQVDMLWNAKDQFPKDFRFEVSVCAKWQTRPFLLCMDFYMQLLFDGRLSFPIWTQLLHMSQLSLLFIKRNKDLGLKNLLRS